MTANISGLLTRMKLEGNYLTIFGIPFNIVVIMFFVIAVVALFMVFSIAGDSAELCRKLCECKGGIDYSYSLGRCGCDLRFLPNLTKNTTTASPTFLNIMQS